MRLLLIGVIEVYLSGCATIVRGTSEDLFLNSTPSGTTAKLSMGQSCTTPCNLKISRSESFTVTFSRTGCDDQTVSVFPTLAGAGVLLGGLVDYGTGAVYSLKPNPVVATLRCSDETHSPQVNLPPSVNANSPVTERLEHLNGLRDKGLVAPQEYEQKRGEMLKGL